MSVNSQHQTYKQFKEGLIWFNRKYKRSEKKHPRSRKKYQ